MDNTVKLALYRKHYGELAKEDSVSDSEGSKSATEKLAFYRAAFGPLEKIAERNLADTAGSAAMLGGTAAAAYGIGKSPEAQKYIGQQATALKSRIPGLRSAAKGGEQAAKGSSKALGSMFRSNVATQGVKGGQAYKSLGRAGKLGLGIGAAGLALKGLFGGGG